MQFMLPICGQSVDIARPKVGSYTLLLGSHYMSAMSAVVSVIGVDRAGEAWAA